MNIINKYWNAYIVTNMGEDFKILEGVKMKHLETFIIPKAFYNGSKYLFPKEQEFLIEKIFITNLQNSNEVMQLKYYLLPYKIKD